MPQFNFMTINNQHKQVRWFNKKNEVVGISQVEMSLLEANSTDLTHYVEDATYCILYVNADAVMKITIER